MNIKLGDTHTLDTVQAVPPASALEIDCGNMLDLSPKRSETLGMLLSKLRRKGRIIITGADIQEISRFLFLAMISEQECVSMVYGGRQSISSVTETSKTLRGLGLTILSCRLDGLEYRVVAERA